MPTRRHHAKRSSLNCPSSPWWSWSARFGLFRATVVIAAALACATPAAAQIRVVNYNIAQLNGNLAALENVFIAIQADDKPGFNVPVSIFVFQEVQIADVAALHSMLSRTAPPGVTYATGTFTNSGEDGSGGAQAMFYRTAVVSEITAAHLDIPTGAGRNTDRWRFRLRPTPTTFYISNDATFYLYSSHLKADTGTANQNARLQGVIAIRDNADAQPAGTNVIYAGDFNFYNNSEPGYLEFIAAGNGQAIDPLGVGSWAGAANAFKHTQAPCDGGCSLVGGGMNDRFDFQLPNLAASDNAGFARIAGTYRAFGNDGQHYETSINSGNNTYYPLDIPRSNALAANLLIASDHIPIIHDYQLPAIMTASMPADLGRVIQNAAVIVPISVTNTAPAVIITGADELNFTAIASGGLSGSANDTVLPLGDLSEPTFALNTAALGPVAGTVTLTSASQAVQNSSVILNTAAIVIRPASPSLNAKNVQTEANLIVNLDPDTGVQTFAAPVHNLGYDANQALLDIDAVSAPANPFAFVGGKSPGIGDMPATLTFAFDTADLPPGRYTAQAVITVSDENLPGEAASTLTLNLQVVLGDIAPCPADVTGDTAVNVDDLLAVIGAWGPCPPPPPACSADINLNGFVNVDDLLTVIGGWGSCL